VKEVRKKDCKLVKLMHFEGKNISIIDPNFVAKRRGLIITCKFLQAGTLVAVYKSKCDKAIIANWTGTFDIVLKDLQNTVLEVTLICKGKKTVKKYADFTVNLGNLFKSHSYYIGDVGYDLSESLLYTTDSPEELNQDNPFFQILY